MTIEARALVTPVRDPPGRSMSIDSSGLSAINGASASSIAPTSPASRVAASKCARPISAGGQRPFAVARSDRADAGIIMVEQRAWLGGRHEVIVLAPNLGRNANHGLEGRENTYSLG